MIEFINRTDYVGRNPQEVGNEFTKMLDEYKEYVKDFTDEQCKEEENRLMGIMDKWGEVQKDIAYALPKEVMSIDGRTVTRSKVGEYINDLLARVECEFSYTLGYYQIYLWWKKPLPTIPYHMCDSTLNVLGSGLRFRGPEQWSKILVINEYFKSIHDEYAIDNMLTYLYGTCHSALLDRMAIVNKVESTEPQVVDAEQGPITME